MAVTFTLIVIAARAALISVAADRAPYAFSFVGVVLAAVLAGWRAGLLTLILSQVMTFYVIVEPRWALAKVDADRSAAFVIATVSVALILLIIALYQREVAKGVIERESRLDLLGRALEEIDHRTRNNYQTVLALVQLQAQRSKDAGVQEALQQVADRIKAVTRATERLAVRSDDIGTVRLRDHLCELCEQVERGLSRDGVKVECEVEDLTVSTEKAIYLSIIVNELVTNALKHAFEDSSEGLIRVASEQHPKGVTIIVEDNGSGLAQAPAKGGGGGLGTRLVDRFARELGCEHEVVSSESGTTHRLMLRSLG
ncbi:MAG TPA: histidine kinase dimerization/phosphoacceptor domain -containing protein [Sphingomicrobium sp.]|nr:histidine kinase dimerization/phosphoacceptor domain -containing protein [Sphingomicrobium sp.]